MYNVVCPVCKERKQVNKLFEEKGIGETSMLVTISCFSLYNICKFINVSQLLQTKCHFLIFIYIHYIHSYKLIYIA